MSILRVFSLYMVKEARTNKLHMAILDPQMLALAVVKADTNGDVSNYVASVMSHYSRTKKDFIIFPLYTVGHCIAVVVNIKWGIVYYLDSIFQASHDISSIQNLLDKAYSTFVASDPTRKKKGKVVLKHTKKFTCHQQPPSNVCGFYAAHHLLFIASAASKMQKPEEFIKLTTEPLEQWVLAGHREQIIGFIVNDILNPKGEFHLPRGMY